MRILNQKKESLRRKLIAPFIVGMLGLTISLVAYTFHSMHSVVEGTALAFSKTKTDNTVHAMTVLIKSLHSRAQDLVIDPGIVKLLKEHNENPVYSMESKEQMSRRLISITEGFRYFRDILLLDKNAKCIASSNDGYLTIDYSNEEYVQQAIDGHYFLGNFSVGKVSKTFSAYFSAPITIGSEFLGILIIISDLPKLVQYKTDNASVAGVIFTSILAPNGTYMAHKDKKLLGGKQQHYQKTYQQFSSAGEQGRKIFYQHDGKKYLGYARIEPNTRWMIITSGATKEVFATAYDTGIIVFIFGIGFLFIISFLVIRHVTDVINSLLSLIFFAKQVAKGDLDIDIGSTNRTDELGVLHHSLEHLVTTLKQNLQEKEHVNKMKDEFLANMSHEIRTPLNAIIGMSYLAEKKELSIEKRNLYLSRIKIAAESLLGIINDILDISKVEAGKMSIEKKPFELREMIEDTLAIHRETARAEDIAITFEYAEDSPQYYMGDIYRIRQILNNLLSNAIKFTQQGSVHVACWKNDIHQEKHHVYFKVSDTGPGIAEELLSYLFKPFTQADASVTRQFGGTGLGLTICRNLISLMEGNMWVESEVGTGTTFTFYIPLSIASINAIQSIEDNIQRIDIDNEQTKGKRILLAEDNSINQLIFKNLIEPLEVETTIVNNGQQAVKAFQENSFDLILMDIQMPVMGGIEATQQIRALEKEKKCPIVALSANAREKDKSAAQAAGMNDYITKPINPPVFEKTIRKWLSQK